MANLSKLLLTGLIIACGFGFFQKSYAQTAPKYPEIKGQPIKFVDDVGDTISRPDTIMTYFTLVDRDSDDFFDEIIIQQGVLVDPKSLNSPRELNIILSTLDDSVFYEFSATRASIEEGLYSFSERSTCKDIFSGLCHFKPSIKNLTPYSLLQNTYKANDLVVSNCTCFSTKLDSLDVYYKYVSNELFVDFIQTQYNLYLEQIKK